MKYFKGLLFVFGVALLSSCIKHEIIPPPSPKVDLQASFIGSLNGSTYEIIKDVDGYRCVPSQAKALLPLPQLSNVKYYSALSSNSKLDYLQIGIGLLEFNKDYSINPSLEEFTNFFENNLTRPYKLKAENGVEIIYRDGDGKIWISDPNASGNTFVFSKLTQESDGDGDYMKFTAKFDCKLVRDVDDPDDPEFGTFIDVQAGVFTGYFEKEN